MIKACIKIMVTGVNNSVILYCQKNRPLPIQNWSVLPEIVSKAMSWYDSVDTPRGLVNLSVPICIF